MERDTVRLSKWPYTRTYCFQDFGRYSQCTLSHNCTVYHPDVINENRIHRELQWKSSHRLQYSQELISNPVFHIHPENNSLSCVTTAAVLPQDLKH